MSRAWPYQSDAGTIRTVAASSGGAAGTGGKTGTGGMPETAMVRAAHLAPEVGTVDVLVNGDSAGIALAFGQASAFAEVPLGVPITFQVVATGTTDPVLLEIGPETFQAGDMLNAIVYGDGSAENGVAAFAISGVNEALAGSGTVIVAHGEALDRVNIISTVPGACPPPVIEDLAFGATSELILPETTLSIALNLASSPECGDDFEPLGAPVTPDVVTILVAVLDGDSVAVYALVPDTEGDIPTLGPAEFADLRMAHLAPDIPAMGDTAVDFLVDGNVVFSGLVFAESSPFSSFPIGTYTFGIAVAGEETPVVEFPATLEADQDLTVVAYATGEDPPVGLLAFDVSLADLPVGEGRVLVGHGAGEGRVLVGHGANDPTLATVNVLNTASCPPQLISGLTFGSVAGSLDLLAADYEIAFNLPTSKVPRGALRGVESEERARLEDVARSTHGASATREPYRLTRDSA